MRTGTWSDGLSAARVALSIETAFQAVRGARRQQQVIDPDPLVPLPCPGLVIPERIESRLVRRGPEGVGQSKVEQRPKALPGLGEEQGVTGPGRGIVDVARFGDDVEVTGQDKALFGRQQGRGPLGQPVHEAELVGIFVRVGRIAVGQIDGRDANRARGIAHHGLHVAGLKVGVVSRQAGGGLGGRAGQDRDTVEALLALDVAMVSGRFHL